MCLTIKLQLAGQAIDVAAQQARAAARGTRVAPGRVADPDLKAVAETVARVERGLPNPDDAFERQLAGRVGKAGKSGPTLQSFEAALAMAAVEIMTADGKAGGKVDGALELCEQKTLSPVAARLLSFAKTLKHAHVDHPATAGEAMDELVGGGGAAAAHVHH